MYNEQEKIYTVRTEFASLDRHGYIKPNAYQTIMNKIVEEHLQAYSLDVDSIMPYGLSWVLISFTFDIKKHIKGCQELSAKTWHSEHRGPFYRREIELKDMSGDVVCLATTISILLDLQTRSIYRKKELPFDIGEANKVFLTKASPSFRGKYEFETIDTRAVKRSYIDCLGHVNNCKYGEFAFDALTDTEADLAKISRVEIYFMSELRPHDTFTVDKTTSDGRVLVRGHNNEKEDTSFMVVFSY